MHREDTATLTTYLSDNLKIFTCLTPLDDQPIVIFNRVQDPSPPIQNNFSSDQQNRANYLNNKPNTAQQPRYNSLYSAAAKRYFATITLSSDELDSFRAFLPVIDNFYHFQLYIKNKQSSRTSESVQLWLWTKQTRSLCSTPKSSESHVGSNGQTKKFLNLDWKKHHHNVRYHLMRCRMSCDYMSWSTPKLKKSSINQRSRKRTHQPFVIN